MNKTFEARRDLRSWSLGSARRVGPLLAAAILALASAVPGARVMAAPYNPGHFDESTRSGLASICRNVMGLQPGEEHFDNCMESLSDSEINISRGGALAASRSTCLSQGFAPNTAGLAECELRSSESGRRASAPAIDSPYASSSPIKARSYFSTPNGEVHQREELSCARLGYEPAAPGFDSCVGGLAAALFEADNPAQ